MLRRSERFAGYVFILVVVTICLRLPVLVAQATTATASNVCRRSRADSGELVANDDDNNNNNNEDEDVSFCDDNPTDDASRKLSESLRSAQDVLECGLYMAPSSIPNSGWGMYTGIPLTSGSIIHPMDVSIQLLDHARHQQTSRKQRFLYPEIYNQAAIPDGDWLIAHYDWNPLVTHAAYEAAIVNSIIPGLGMLANSHTGLINVANRGPTLRQPLAQRSHPGAGSFSHYQDMTFAALYDVPAGHELFVEYGDHWFESRAHKFGQEVPLSTDFRQADDMLSTFKRLVNDQLSSNLAADLYQLLRYDVFSGSKSRLLSALPKTIEAVVEVLSIDREGVSKSAYASVVDVSRDPSWLQENGLCLDHIRPGMSHIRPEQHGAFAARLLPAGTVVAPAPLTHIHRNHLDMFINDPYDDTAILWRGQQLFLNYVYGHPSSSVLLFPYSPVVNLINHGGKEHANLRVRWSSAMSKPEWLNLTSEELLAITDRSGLMMEFIATRDIKEGEEVLIDYGDDWQQAWDKHVEHWRPPDRAEHYISAWTFNEREMQIKEAANLMDWVYPMGIVTVCWVNNAFKPTDDDPEWYIWAETPCENLAETKPCNVLKRYVDDDGRDLYNVGLFEATDWDYPQVKSVPRHAITFVEQRYAGHQALRQAFRREIMLPDDMVPEKWKDINAAQPHDSACGLYVAESSIPNAGLGMYTAKDLRESQAMFYGEMVIQVEDVVESSRLRRWHNNQSAEENEWLMENYLWQILARESNQSNQLDCIPGLGMLANSHTGVVNSLIRLPQTVDRELGQANDPEVGAVTNYHDLFFMANQDIAAGSELFVPYGDHWFAGRREMFGSVPLSHDFEQANSMLNNLTKVVGNIRNSEDVFKDLWKLLTFTLSTYNSDHLLAALPKDPDDVAMALDIGTAKYSVRHQRRSLEWLASNGRCLDNIRPGKSKMPQAGRGAFATRLLRNGSIVTAAPVVHFQRKHLEVFGSKIKDGGMTEIFYEGMQLLWNYCLGHPQSSLIFFPYSPVVNYINHGGQNHNARLEWSSLSHHRKDWLARSPDDLVANETHAGLILEVVATKDIAPGDEVLLDYGENWANAWKRHVASWKPYGSNVDYVPASTFNHWMESIRTSEEQIDNPYPNSIYTACWVNAYDSPEESQLGTTFEWTYTNGLYHKSDWARRCEVLERHEIFTDMKDSVNAQQNFYVVKVHQSENTTVILRNVPRRAIQFLDEKDARNPFLRGAFRHEIVLPKALVPDAWIDMNEGDFVALYGSGLI